MQTALTQDASTMPHHTRPRATARRTLAGTGTAALVAALALALAGCGGTPKAPAPSDAWVEPAFERAPHSGWSTAGDEVVFSFASVGDSRQDPTNPDPTTLIPPLTGSLLEQDRIWLQNTRAWSRILRAVQDQKASMLVVNGDMVMGYGRSSVPEAWASRPPSVNDVAASDIARLQRQYAYWRGMVAGLFETGTYVLPVPGNHETQCSDTVTTQKGACRKGKSAYAENEDAWRANMGDLIVDTRRFNAVTGFEASQVSGIDRATAPGPAEGFTTDQSKLSYSFDVKIVGGLLHFAVINTFATGQDGVAPVQWLARDLEQARARGARQIFVFGHKPAFNYNAMAIRDKVFGPDGLDPTPAGGTPGSKAFWKVIVDNGATYFAGHLHVMHLDRIALPTDPAQPLAAVGTRETTPRGAAWQVLVGSGGSPFDATLEGRCPDCRTPKLNEPTDRYYAWARVLVHRSGRVSLEIWGFDDKFGPARVLKVVNSLQSPENRPQP